MARDEYYFKPKQQAKGFKDLTGKRFDKLLVIKLVGRRLYGDKNGK